MNTHNRVSEVIATNIPCLIDSWVECVRRRVPASGLQGREELVNDLKLFFENLVLALNESDYQAEERFNIKISSGHGRQRLEATGYSLEQVIEEYHLLRVVVFNFLDEYGEVPHRERNIINEFIDCFIRIAAGTFSDELNRDLREALDLRDEFIANVSHELKTPLTSMKLQTQLSKRKLTQGALGGSPTEGIIHFIDQNERGINRLSHLVEDMVDISRINSRKLELKSEEFFLTVAVSEVLQEMESYLAEYHCHVRTHLPAEIRLTCDKFRFEQILTNLLSNAAKYGAGGDIDLVAREKDREVVIEVQDHGRGIAPQDQQRIFERYERVSAPGERNGIGLGLYIVKNLTNLLGGDIELKSWPGQGSNFIVHLPLH